MYSTLQWPQLDSDSPHIGQWSHKHTELVMGAEAMNDLKAFKADERQSEDSRSINLELD